ncbi:MAG: outer membrane beta-barrel protein [Moraxellaceae bacterium]|nr:outer membrane beta-barrel protein [Moraxellaceae bacterium]
MKKTNLVHLLTLSLIATPVAANTMPNGKPYLFGTLGYVQAEDEEDSPGVIITKNDGTINVSVGAGFALNEFVAFEATYLKSGDIKQAAIFPDDGISVDLSTTFHGGGPGVVATLPINEHLSFFVRADYLYLNVDNKFKATDENGNEGSLKLSSSGWNNAFGAGVQYKLNNDLTIRGQWRLTQLEQTLAGEKVETDLNEFSMGILKAF